MRPGIREMPEIIWTEPKVKRVMPVMASWPIMAMHRPRRPEAMPLQRSLPETPARQVMPIMAMAKYSGAPNR